MERKIYCVECSTTTTPMWRGGPAGPRSLCNACGIKYRKKKRGILGLDKMGSRKCGKNRNGRDEEIKRESVCSEGNQDMQEWKTGERRWRWRKLREEEEAAILLMALSCDGVYA